MNWALSWEDQSGSVRDENLLTEVKRTTGPSKRALVLLWTASCESLAYFPMFCKSASSHQAQLGILSPSSQSSLIPKFFSYFTCFPPSSHPRTNPIQLPPLEEPGNWTRKDVCSGSATWSTLTPASLPGGLELEPTYPVPLTVVLRAKLPGLSVCVCV